MSTVEELRAELLALQKVQQWAVKSEDARRFAAMIDLARSEPGIPILPDEMDRDHWLLNCPDGTLDLRTGTLRPHRREDLITKLCPTPYQLASPCPTWLRFLKEVFAQKKELIDYIQRLLGYCLTGDTSEHLLAVLHGNGANGKSVFINTILAVMGGDYAMTAMPDLLMERKGERHPTEIATLFGKRLLVCQETGSGRRLHEPLAKWLTGGDRLQARKMKEDFWEFTPTHKAVLVTNYKPEVRGTDEGIWRRLRLIPFEVTFPEDQQDKQLGQKLLAEAPGILAWAVQGCLEWQRDGMRTPECVTQATTKYREEEDVVRCFLNECCIEKGGCECRASALYSRFKEWAKGNGDDKPMSQKAFGSVMTTRGVKRKSNNGTWYEGVTTK
jgi:putative DNA primase/helicase